MVIISTSKTHRIALHRRSGVQLAAFFALIIVVALILINLYLTYTTVELVFSTKESSMYDQTSIIVSSLAQLDSLTSENVEQVMNVLDDSSGTRTVVTDAGGYILYDTSGYASDAKYALYSELVAALSGKDVFHSEYREGAFVSCSASPVMIHSLVAGAVYLYDYDTEQAAFVNGILDNNMLISLVVCLIVLVFGVLLALRLSARFGVVLNAISRVGEGEFEHRAVLDGGDEIAVIADEFNQLTERLNVTENARRRFVSDASHELKTPLASIQLLSDSVLQSEDMPPELVRDFVSDIGQEAGRLNRITEKLLSLSRIDGDRSVPITEVDLAQVVQSCCRLLRPLADEKSVTLGCSVDEGVFVSANEDELRQVVLNLTENAIKYSTSDGAVNVLLFAAEGEAVFIVDDTGVGIPEEDIPHIFERFYRVDKARSREAGGSGLGLAIVHEIVTKYGGSIKADRRHPQGTRFEAHFPLSGEGK